MTPRLKKLYDQLGAIRDGSWFSLSKNRFAKRARRAIKRALRRERKRDGQREIREQNDMGEP